MTTQPQQSAPPQKTTLKVSNEEEAWAMVEGDHPDFLVISNTINGQDRWTTVYSVILFQPASMAWWEGWYVRGSTEMQEGSEDVCQEFMLVRPITRTVIDFEIVLTEDK